MAEGTQMAKLGLRELMRTGHVRRWHIVRVAREQTIAEHMYRVWLIVSRIVDDDKFGLDQQQAILCKEWALLHDQPEVITGDIPTPSKRRMVEFDINKLEASIDSDFGDCYNQLKSLFPQVLAIVKLADLVEMLAFLQIEGLGRHAESVLADIDDDFREHLSDAMGRWPDLRWSVFLEVRNGEI